MQLAHVIPSPCISRVVRIITEILLTSPPNRTLFDSMNGVSALTSLFMLFDASCITHELFIAVNDFCEFLRTQQLESRYGSMESLLLNWNIWRKGDSKMKVDSLAYLSW